MGTGASAKADIRRNSGVSADHREGRGEICRAVEFSPLDVVFFYLSSLFLPIYPSLFLLVFSLRFLVLRSLRFFLALPSLFLRLGQYLHPLPPPPLTTPPPASSFTTPLHQIVEGNMVVDDPDLDMEGIEYMDSEDFSGEGDSASFSDPSVAKSSTGVGSSWDEEDLSAVGDQVRGGRGDGRRFQNVVPVVVL